MARTSKTGITVAEIKASELYGVLGKAATESAALSDAAIEQKLFAAEDFYERDLQLRWKVTRVFSAPETRLNHPDAALRLSDYDPAADMSEAAYDYDPRLWDHSRWALIQLRRRPVRSIARVIFIAPGAGKIWQVPLEWVQIDRKYGSINILPTTGPAVTMTFGRFLLSVFAGGRGLPHAIIIDYETGFSPEELQQDHQDLLNGVRLRTLLLLGGIIGNIVAGGRSATSLGLDGLSKSSGFNSGKFGAYSGAIQLAMDQEAEVRESWRAKEQGPAMAFA